MLSYLELLLLSLAYLLTLFAVAWWGDRLGEQTIRRYKPFIVSLGATIYCSAWSFYGTTAQAAYNGWYFPPTFLGSIFLLLFAAAPIKKLIQASKRGNVTSLADYLAMSFGRSRPLAAIVTVLCLILLIPYIALQLKAIALSFHILTDNLVHSHYLLDVPVVHDTAFYIAVILGVFAIAFGTRHLDSREHHNGLMIAIAFEALVKITAFFAIAWFVSFTLFNGLDDIALRAARSDSIAALIEGRQNDQGFLAAVVLGVIAIICLPRQFHVLVVETESPKDFNTVRWVLPVYLIIFGLCILPIAYGGLLTFSELDISAEQFVLRLPLSAQRSDLALLAYLGGLSAGSSMVIVACVAMATMVCNELIVPALLSNRWLNLHKRRDISSYLRLVRRLTILLLMLLAYGYHHLFANNNALGAIGLSAFALVAQFAPALYSTLRAGQRDVRAAIIGIAIGFIFWCYTLLLPMLVSAGWIDTVLLEEGPWGIAALRPTALFGLTGLATISHGVLWSLCINIFVFTALSYWFAKPQTVSEEPKVTIPVHQLQALAARFLGADQARLALLQYPSMLIPQAPAGDDFVEFIENLLAGVIGSVSARHVIEHARENLETNSPLLDETSEIYHFSRELLQASIDNISQGISVVDKQLRLVAWNRRYLEIFEYPANTVHVGRHVSDLLHYNAERGGLASSESIEHFVEKRLQFMSAGSPYVVKRSYADTKVLEIRGNPMPGGGFVTTFTDITEYQNTLEALQESRDLLEHRVAERTLELQSINGKLREANVSKTRFLAAAGHDLVQPLNAAKLFTNALLQEIQLGQPNPDIQQQTLNQLNTSLQSADSIISELLAIAKLDAGAIEPHIEAFKIADLLKALQQDYTLAAKAKNLSFAVKSGTWVVDSDYRLLRRVLQNLMANALRYTDKGRILVTARQSQDQVIVDVWDTGKGIPESELKNIFVEFRRLHPNARDGGLGLGLATVDRLCKLLNIKLEVHSAIGRGSRFRLRLSASKAAPKEIHTAFHAPQTVPAFDKLKVLCLDNEVAILNGMEALLAPWGCQSFGATTTEEALTLATQHEPDIVLADYHLDNGDNGVKAVYRIQRLLKRELPAIIISADYDDKVKTEARSAGFYFLKKPVKVAALRALMNRLIKQQAD